MLKRFAAVILFLLPVGLYAQAGPGPVPFRGSATWNLIWPSDNTFDIGASGATRPRTGYFGTSVVTPSLTVSGLTSGRVPFASTGGLLADAAGLTWDGTILGATRFQAGAGSSSLASFRMTVTNTGFAEVNSTNWGWYVAGTERVRLGSGGAVSSTGGFFVGASVAGADVAFGRVSAGVASITTGASTRHLMGGGANVGSATALPVPVASLYHVTGTTTITSITSTNIGTGTCITLIFDGVLTFTDGSNLKLAGDFVTTADDTWTGCYDGTNWYETGRTVN
jgi:hypothetical protein